LSEADRAQELALGATGHRANGELDRRVEVVARQRVSSSLAVARRGALGRRPTLVVLAEEARVRLSGDVEPVPREAMTELAIAVGECGVRGLPHEGVPEPELGCAGELARGSALEKLGLDQRLDRNLQRAVCVGQERRCALLPERF